MKTLIVLLCLLVAVPAWSCAILNAGDHSELGGECTPNELSALLNAFQKQLGSSDSMPQPLIIMNYKFVPEQKPKPKFYRVLGYDMRIRKDKTTGYRVQPYADNPVDGPMMWNVQARWNDRWYWIYDKCKTLQECVDWLDRNGP